MADPLGKLVHLTSLDLSSTCHGGVGCVACVYACRAVSECAWWGVSCVRMHTVPCPSVRGRLCQCEAV